MKRRREFTEIVVSDYEKISILAKSLLCRGMLRDEVQVLAPFFQTYHIDSGTDIYQEGDTEAFLCLIVSGSVKVCKEYGGPTEKMISKLGAGETIGEMSVIDEKTRSASVIATSESILYAITRRNLVELHGSSQTIWAKLIYNIAVCLCHRLRQTNDMLSNALNWGPGPFSESTAVFGTNTIQQPFLKAVDE